MKKTFFDALCSCDVFKDVPPGELRGFLLLDGIGVKSFRRGEVIFSPVSFERMLGVILRGEAGVSKTNPTLSGGGVLMSRLSAGDAFGMAALFCENFDFPTSITALSDCEVLFFSKQALKKIFISSPQTAENYITLLSEKIHFLNKKIDAFTSADARGKLLCWLKAQSENGNTSVEISMVSLAKTLDLGRTSLYRALDALSDEEIIKKDGKRLIINPEIIL
ncbi:MAG: Crp/Fnr family transcriptional regulator [Clostridiales bacterium]|nr:Crp/Fnr family transcriptional regulator [Clostridiales bacterium]